MPDRLVNVSVLLGGPGRGYLRSVKVVVDDRLEKVQRADDVRHHRLVRTVPGLADMRLRGQVEDVRPFSACSKFSDDAVDRVPVGEISPVDGQAAAEMRDVVERAARRRTDKSKDVRAEPDE